MASEASGNNGCLKACAALGALVLATVLFGFDRVGAFCIFAGPALVLANGLRGERFEFWFWNRAFARRTNPRGFWTAAAIVLLVAAAGLACFVAILLAGHVPG